MLVTRPDVDMHGEGARAVKGLEEMAAKLQRQPRAVFLMRNTWGLHDQWCVGWGLGLGFGENDCHFRQHAICRRRLPACLHAYTARSLDSR
jgi:hypothetical protein